MRVALLAGSFNPIHKAHVKIALWALGCGTVDEVWILPSPQNPLKTVDELASWDDRVAMIDLAIRDNRGIKVCTIEKELTAPFYTINTIARLQNEYPDIEFSILCGSDIIDQLPEWHRIDELREMVRFIEYPRGMGEADVVLFAENSTAIRRGDMYDGLDDSVRQYIDTHQLYYAAPLAEAQRAFSESRFSDVINLATAHRSNYQIEQLAQMSREILDFRYTDIYNP